MDEPQVATVQEFIDRLTAIYRESGVCVEKGFTVEGSDEQVFQINGHHTGKGLPPSDMNIFLQMRELFVAPRIFIIGNAFGWSTIFLALLFPGASIDVIDAECEGGDPAFGTKITREIVSNLALDIQVTVGRSPEDVAKACRHGQYDLVFIDGDHKVDQLVRDFGAVAPVLSDRCVVMMHDVFLCNLYKGFQRIKQEFGTNFQYMAKIKGSSTGMAVAYRGLEVPFKECNESKDVTQNSQN